MGSEMCIRDRLGPVGGHGIAGLDGTQDDRALVGALVAHNADGLNVGQNRKVLPAAVLGVALAGLLKQALVVGVELLAHDSVGILQNFQLLLQLMLLKNQLLLLSLLLLFQLFQFFRAIIDLLLEF